MAPRVVADAQLRGALVGVLSGVIAIAGHGIGVGRHLTADQMMPAMAGAVPGPGALMLLVGACAVVGALVAAAPAAMRGRVGLLLTLVAGQVTGHLVLGLTVVAHSMSPTVPMLSAHLAATVTCVLVVGVVEHAWGVVHGTLDAVAALVAGLPFPAARAAYVPGRTTTRAFPGSWHGWSIRLRGPPGWGVGPHPV